MKNILLIGGNGALGVYLVKETLAMGYKVDVVCFEDAVSTNPNLTYIKHDGKDFQYMAGLVKKGYDTIVDFMLYYTVEEFKPFCDLYLTNTKHYLFLSTYRVYAGTYPVTEDSPRLLDIEKPGDFVNEYEYSIYKAQCEDYIISSGCNNWTILRPSITYSKNRFQLTILEADTFVWRMRHNKTVVLPEGAMDVQGTLTWAGDFGKAVSKLLFNPEAYCQAFTVSTAEHHTWREIAEIYKRIGGLKYITVDNDTFIYKVLQGNVYTKQQLLYDRCFNRIIDNSKLLRVTGLKQSDFMPLEKGLKMELDAYNGLLYNETLNQNIDSYLKEEGIE